MAIRYSNGIGKLYDTESQQPIGDVKYQITEFDKTRYTPNKWWGEFSTKREIKRPGKYIIELEDTRKGECVVTANTEAPKGSRSQFHYYYHFNGRGKLGRHFSLGS